MSQISKWTQLNLLKTFRLAHKPISYWLLFTRDTFKVSDPEKLKRKGMGNSIAANTNYKKQITVSMSDKVDRIQEKIKTKKDTIMLKATIHNEDTLVMNVTASTVWFVNFTC